MTERERLIAAFPELLSVEEGEYLLKEICRLANFQQFKVSDKVITKALNRVDTLDEESLYLLNNNNYGDVSEALELVFGMSLIKKYKSQRALKKSVVAFLKSYATFRYFELHPSFNMEDFMAKVSKEKYWEWRRKRPLWCVMIKGRRPDNHEWGIWRSTMYRSRIEAMKERYDLGTKYSDIFTYNIVYDDNKGYDTYELFPYPSFKSSKETPKPEVTPEPGPVEELTSQAMEEPKSSDPNWIYEIYSSNF